MRILKSVLFGAAILACVPGVATAQAHQRFHINFGGGPTFISGDLGDRFKTGYGPAVGLTIDINDRLGFQFEYAFRRFHAENYVDILGGQFTGYHDTNQLAFDMIFNINQESSKVRVYAVAGPGAYYRRVTITEYVGTGVVCDPYWYICGTYPITDIIGSRSSWDFGFNVGGGVGFKMGETAEFTVESRFHYVAGQEVTGSVPAGAAGGNAKSTGYYVPLTFGFRF